MKRMFYIILLILVLPILYVGVALLYGILTEYKPAAETPVETGNPQTALRNSSDSSFTFLIWNIGYGGLGAAADFFYDGGKMVISPKEKVQEYNEGILKFLGEQRDVDFILLQEVDCGSRRSYEINQAHRISRQLPEHSSAFAMNYRVRYLPFPWTEPLGKINSGLLSMSRFTPESSLRIALPNITDFPRKIFYLKRCMLMQKYTLASGKDLVVINTHFEAYDKGEVKKEQMKLAKKVLEAEYAKGNYVILGGDWNIAPPDFDVHTWEREKEDDVLYLANNDANYIPGWKYVYDKTVPTNRKNKTAYDKDKTFQTVIDYYFVSPNVEVEEVKGVDMGFASSDHQPVKMRIRLK